MHIILFTNTREKLAIRQVHTRFQFAILSLLFAGICAGFSYAGYWYGIDNRSVPSYVRVWDGELVLERYELQVAQQEAHADIDALTLRLGQMQGRIARLDALGRKLVRMADLDGGEFNFDTVPALGGPEVRDDHQSLQIPKLEKAIGRLAEQIDNRKHQLTALEQLIMNRNLADEVLPSGRPIKRGWISSGYGYRTSPFTGKRQFHKGVDFAGETNTEIISVAGGVVIFSEKQADYGYMLEISHGGNYSTRYAHNAKNLVKQGQTVKKGQVIALMGSTGLSTGPHVHFELLKEGRKVNPDKFITASKL